MKKILPILAIAIINILSCQDETKKVIEGNEKIIFSNIYNDSLIESQFFDINSQRDTSLFCKNGTVVRIYANSFEPINGLDLISNIQVEIKEAFNPIDFVLGNLTTTSNGRNLISGGMIFIDAKSNGKKLELKADKEIGIIVPSDSLDEEMMIFSGVRDSFKINWVQPESTLNEQIKTLEQSFISITYQYIGSIEEDDNFSDWLWEPNRTVGDKKIVNGVEVEVISINRNIVALKESGNGLFIPEVITKKGQNGFVQDFNTSYIFRQRKLGWSNIDKFFNDPDAEEIEMIVNVNNQDEFGYVFTSLILPEKNMYIAGYQKMDNSFGFSHNDLEQLVLPVGTEGILMATAYKEDKPYFNLKKFIIGTDMNISINLLETTTQELKKSLEENI